MSLLSSLVIALFSFVPSESIISFDKTEYDFGVVTCGDVLTCSFTLTNHTKKSIRISKIITGCGCTKATFSKSRIRPGKKRTIDVTYHSGALPSSFEEQIFVFFTKEQGPITLKIRGECRSREKSNRDVYREQLGPLNIKSSTCDLGLIGIGTIKKTEIIFANFTDKAERIRLSSHSRQLIIPQEEYVINGGAIQPIQIVLNLMKNSKWGKAIDTIDVISENSLLGEISIQYSVIESINNSESLSYPQFHNKTVSLGVIDKETVAIFRFRNTGETDLHFHSIDYDASCLFIKKAPDTPSEEDNTIEIVVFPKKLPIGRFHKEVTLFTNSPHRPIVKLFISGEKKSE